MSSGLTVSPGPISPPTLKPAISPGVHLSLTVIYTTLYGVLFLIVYIQLWMILYYRHRRLSYQTVFLFLCLIWASLRTILFSFYFKNCSLANDLDTFLYWLLYCCPVCLQYITLCLLVVFFAQVFFRSRSTHETNKYRRWLWIVLVISILIFLGTNITCAVIVRQYDSKSDSAPYTITLARVAINGTLFLATGIALAVCMHKVSKVAASSVMLEARDLTVRQALVACIVIILLYISRAIYNFIALAKPLNSLLSFGYGWINVSDQADFADLGQGLAFISFGIVLFVWEFLPTFIVVMFFRVHRPHSSKALLPDLSTAPHGPRGYFFDNPHRYDSEDDLPAAFRAARIGSLEDPFSVNSSSTQYGSSAPTHVGSPLAGPSRSIPSEGGTVGDGRVPTQSHYYDGT